MNRSVRVAISFVSFTLLIIAAFHLAARGLYGLTLFVLLPAIAGGLGTWSLRASSERQATIIGAAIGSLACSAFLFTGREGYICLVMVLPVVVLLTIAGSLLTYWAGSWLRSKRTTAVLLLVPASLAFDTNATPPIYEVSTRIVVNASPERVWKYVVAFPDIPGRPDWVLRTGIAYPIRTRIAGAGLGAPRSCDLSTGTVQERVEVWDEPHLLRFLVTATPPAMQEMGLYGPIHPKHLEGYYISKEGQFALTALSGGRTLVVGTSWYQHGLWPAEYWRLWSDLVVHHIHRRVLEHIRALAEAENSSR